jgi:transposase
MEMGCRRLVGIDLGIASAHTVRVLDESGTTIAKRKAWPTVESLTAVETAALAGCPAGTRLEVIVEPTGPAWMPIAVFFSQRGHRVFRVSSAKAADLRRFLSRHTKTNGIDADTLARLGLIDPAGLRPLELPGTERAALDRRVRATDRLTRLAAEHKVRIKDLARQLFPMTEVRLLRAVQAELAAHAAERERCYRWVDPCQLARSLPGVADIGGPALVAAIGDPARFPTGKQFRAFTGLTPRASETGDSDRKGQPMSKAGSSLLRTTLIRAADTARKLDPQLARIYHVQMVERGKDHLGANCVVAANLAERFWAVMNRGMPYVICDTDGRPVTAAEAKTIIAEQWAIPSEVRARRRSKKMGKAPQQVLESHVRSDARSVDKRGDLPQQPSSQPTPTKVKQRTA